MKFIKTKTFKINEVVTIECKAQKTSYGFRHLATLYKNNLKLATAKTCYYNRTWESFEFQSVIHKLAEQTKSLTEDEKQQIMNFDNTENELKPLKMLSAIMQITDLFNDDVKLKNDSKLRMLKAQMGEALILPDDWNCLTESVKADRLQKIQNILGE
jgi:hypothetical protein